MQTIVVAAGSIVQFFHALVLTGQFLVLVVLESAGNLLDQSPESWET